MLHMSHPLVLVDAFSGLLFVNEVLLPCVADKWHSVCEKFNFPMCEPRKFGMQKSNLLLKAQNLMLHGLTH